MKRVVWWLGAVVAVMIALLAVAAALIDEPLRAYAERAFNERLKGYTLRIGSLDFHPLGFSLDLEHVTLVQDEHPDPPIVTIPKWSASVHWRELLTGNVVSDHVIERPTLHITRPQAKQEAKDDVSVEERGWREAVLAVYPLDINRFRIVDADMTYLDGPQAVPLRFTHLNFLAGNIRNIRLDGRIYPSDVHVDTRAFGEGRITIDGFADFFSEPFMGIDADVRLEKVALDDLVSLVGRYNIQLRKGVISAIGHVEYSPYTQDVTIQELMLDGMRVDYVHSSGGTGKHEKQTGRQAARTAKKLSNHPDLLLKIDHAKVLDGEFGFVNKAVAPEYRVFVTNLQMELENFSNQLREGTAFTN